MTDHLASLAEAAPRLAQGLSVTVQLTIFGALLAFAIAVVLGLMAGSSSLWLRGPARVVIEFFRGTSLVVQLFFYFFVLPQLGVDLHPMVCGVLGLGLNYGAYGAEVVRGSINSVPAGQWEATIALSLSPAQRIRRVIFPQAWALMIPSLTNLLVHLMKGTAIVSAITLADFTFHLDQLRRVTSTMFSYAAVGLIGYFVLALVLTGIMAMLETHAKHKLGQGRSLRAILSPAPTVAAPGGGAA
ncbi:ectoine/hydroxyectoine ABC transporter permease subunit EhuC [Zhihengliuella salsuginis]|uniref:Ectoine/hydroxyectoine ABC transporter permease subunit EhuC n=1 Tax=Zhihengliuella salsuginis TaxID=578222 RepID=A0ABQ3GAM6_9MICC|nr:ectoine/hydroxyectoine ABC transporter permease subunit EhuC [Zhihengliuella salsuginis]GHC99946.1 ectoine/hydroxyectoine ABC transporter permease subunit EhuC [Zhihengliuella salsuginis]